MQIITLDHATQAHDPLAIQRAVNLLPAGGGTIRVSAGIWPCVGICLLSNVTLELCDGAILLASDDYDAYINNNTTTICEDSNRALIFAKDCSNIAIIGTGTIDGQSECWVEDYHDFEQLGVKTAKTYRPRLIVFEDCNHIDLRDFTINNSPMWSLHLTGCSHGTLEHITMNNDLAMPNTDALDIDGCAYIRIRHCNIIGADDSICLKTVKRHDGQIKPCHDITVEYCTVRSHSCAIKIGTESVGDFYNIRFAHCRTVSSNRSLGIFVRDGASISNVVFEDIECDSNLMGLGYWGRGEAITITVNHRTEGLHPGSIDNIHFNNIRGTSYGAINIHGLPESPLTNIHFNQIDLAITAPFDGEKTYDLRPGIADALEVTSSEQGRKNAYRFDENGAIIGIHSYSHQMPVLFANHVDGLFITNLQYRYTSDHQQLYQKQHALQFTQTVQDITI